MQKTKVEIIEETVEYYKKNLRGVTLGGSCLYFETLNGAKCAVGRCMEDPQPEWTSCPSEGIEYVDDEGEVRIIDFEASLKPEYRGHDPKFWDDLQEFHDWKYNWQSVGSGNILTSYGHTAFEELLNQWKDQ